MGIDRASGHARCAGPFFGEWCGFLSDLVRFLIGMYLVYYMCIYMYSKCIVCEGVSQMYFSICDVFECIWILNANTLLIRVIRFKYMYSEDTLIHV